MAYLFGVVNTMLAYLISRTVCAYVNTNVGGKKEYIRKKNTHNDQILRKCLLVLPICIVM